MKVSVKYHQTILFALLSISLSQNPIVQDDFTFIFPDKGYEGTPISFEVKPFDSEYLYVWDFGHNSQYETFNWEKFEDRAMGPTVEFTYPGQGRSNGFTVKATIYKGVIDRSTKVTAYEKFIPIHNVPPTISLEQAPIKGVEGSELFFKVSHTDPGIADKHEYYWNFDGKKSIGPNSSYQNSNSTTYTFLDDGLYNIFVIVQDDDNDADTVYHQINIENIAPVIETLKHSETGKEGERVSFKSSHFDPGLNDIHTFLWNFGDGELDTAFNNLMDHVFLDDGEFNIQLIIKDNANDADTIQSKIFIENVSPKIKVIIPQNGDE